MKTEHTVIEVRDNLRTTHNWLLRNDQILTLFGLPPNTAIPADYQAEKFIGNVRVMIVPRGSLSIRRRVVAQCPTCSRLVCAGHLDQHMKVHKNGIGKG
jgi:hypothetical protein